VIRKGKRKNMNAEVDLSAFMRYHSKYDVVMDELRKDTTDLYYGLGDDKDGYRVAKVEGNWVIAKALPKPPQAPPAPPAEEPPLDPEVAQIVAFRRDVFPELEDRTTWLRRGLDHASEEQMREQQAVPLHRTSCIECHGRIEHTNRGWILNMDFQYFHSFSRQGLFCLRREPYAQK
jgi:hypothetical protein